jgi:SNF2 family DNA or RNA helicase
MKLTPKQREALRIVADGKIYPDFIKEEDGWHARWRAILCDDNPWVDEFVRRAAVTRLSEDAEDQKHETIHDAWMMALKSDTGLVIWDEKEAESFAAEIRKWNGLAEEDIASRRNTAFRFDPFTISTDVPKSLSSYRALGQAMYIFQPLSRLELKSDKLTVELSRAEAESFIRSAARSLRDALYTVEGVDIKKSISAEAELITPEEKSSDAPPEARIVIKVAGERVNAEEIKFLLDQNSSLVFFRNRWIEVDRNILKQALQALEKSSLRKDISPITFAMGIGRIGDIEIEKVKTSGWLRGLISRLKESSQYGKTPSDRPTPLSITELKGNLRPYQSRGVQWINFLTSNGFGALLADDMGLGKTIQTIAWILLSKAKRKNLKTLIVAPLTLLSNWKHEFEKFAPSLTVYVHQGENRRRASGFLKTANSCDVTITSYNLLVRDQTSFSEVKWDAMTIDEAQTIKNHDTHIAKAVKSLTPRLRLALTGTPIENSLADIWSIEEFLNPGFLGDYDSYRKRFVRPMAENETGSAGKKLKHALEPFLLRRLKSDREIAGELGEKREINEYCILDSQQKYLYDVALQDFKVSPKTQGDIFALLTELKLICDGIIDETGELKGGKIDRLVELVRSIFENNESVLIFTQYAKIGALIHKKLLSEFGLGKSRFLHGGLSAKAREKEIREFSRHGHRAFVLSLKAGGYGLNLVKASHVIHFDRWWNPAVENQATDRAHRIGQTRTVFVHRFISSGTLEERIDSILERKSRLAGAIISESDWLEAAYPDLNYNA